MKKRILILSSLLLLIMAIAVQPNLTYGEKLDYFHESPWRQLGTTVNIYSNNEAITKDSTITYLTEDGKTQSFKALKGNVPGGYLFSITANKKGLWKQVSVNGVDVSIEELNFKVFTSMEKQMHTFYAEHFAEKKINVRRIAGKDRYDTALKISEDAFREKRPYLLIATGQNFIDGLVGGSFSSQFESPLLLVRKDSVPAGTLEEIKRIDLGEIFILGGEAAVSKNVENILKTSGYPVSRLEGQNRIETAAKISEKRFDLSAESGLKPGGEAVVSGRNFPNALAAGPYIGIMAKKGIAFYGLNAWVPNDTVQIIYDIIFGGTAVLPIGEENAKRFEGHNRYETAVMVAEAYPKDLKFTPKTIILASGEDYADGITAAALAGKNDAAVLLTRKNLLPIEVYDYLLANKAVENIIIVGGENAVHKDIENALKGIPAE